MLLTLVVIIIDASSPVTNCFSITRTPLRHSHGRQAASLHLWSDAEWQFSDRRAQIWLISAHLTMCKQPKQQSMLCIDQQLTGNFYASGTNNRRQRHYVF